MHILIDATCISDETFGTSQYALCLLRELAGIDNGNRYSILIKEKLAKSNQVFDLSGQDNFKLIGTPLRLGGPQQQFKLCLPRNRVNPDVFHCLTYNLPLLFNTYKSVCTVHDLKFIVHPEYMHSKATLKKLYFYWITRFASHKCSRIISISESTKQDLVKYVGVSANKIHVIPEASTLHIDTVASEDEQQAVCTKFSISKKYFLIIGCRRPHKNIKNAIKAFLYLMEKTGSDDLQLVITGSAQPYADSKHLAADMDAMQKTQIITTGFVSEDELDSLYRKAHALLYPSLYEGFGLPILEAMERGVPVITSNRTSMPEVGGDAAILVDPTDYRDIAKGLEKIMDKQVRGVCVKNGYARSAEFSWKKTAEQTLQVYRQVAG
ncbi:MAG: glycosyltransferase family 1 protein [Thermodesulfobacteriota bacterium]|nr:glycosyltransferase family 1 protein [Thermodesulfobacteriota bacterium]